MTGGGSKVVEKGTRPYCQASHTEVETTASRHTSVAAAVVRWRVQHVVVMGGRTDSTSLPMKAEDWLKKVRENRTIVVGSANTCKASGHPRQGEARGERER